MGFASGDNGWAIAANTTVTLKFYMKTKESNVNCWCLTSKIQKTDKQNAKKWWNVSTKRNTHHFFWIIENFWNVFFYSSKMSFKSHFKNLQISSRCENLKPTAMLLQSCEIVDGLMPVACASSAWVMPLELSKALNFTLMITSGMFFTT